MPLSSLVPDGEEDGPAVDPQRFLPADHPTYPGAWAIPPHSWARLPEEKLLATESLHEVRVDVMTGAMPIDVNAAGLAISLKPQRPTPSWTRRSKGSAPRRRSCPGHF